MTEPRAVAGSAGGLGAAKAAASVVLPSGLAVPPSAVQRGRYPQLAAFVSRARVGEPPKPGLQPPILAWEIQLGVQTAMDGTGRAMLLRFIPGEPARATARSMRACADALDQLAAQIEAEGADPRDTPAAPKGPLSPSEPAPVQPARLGLAARLRAIAARLIGRRAA